MYPQININMKKLEQNLDALTLMFKKENMKLMIVTKVVCADDKIIEMISHNDYVGYYADSRIENLINIIDLEEKRNLDKKEKVLLRLPMISDADRVVRFADISLNSEIKTIKALDEAAALAGKIHKIILMIDVGDLREGIYYTEKDKIYDSVNEIMKLKNIVIEGIGVNLTCYGAVIPHEDNLSIIADFANEIEERFSIEMKIITGGNSSSLHAMFTGEIPKKINCLRIGEALYLANETAYSQTVEGMNDDCFDLEAEIIEIGQKPSLPVGDIGVDAFGKKPYYEDEGIIKRAIIAIGKQDIDLDCVIPFDENIKILGASSDHMILNIDKCEKQYKLGDTVKFRLNYGGLLKLFTSKYIGRKYFG